MHRHKRRSHRTAGECRPKQVEDWAKLAPQTGLTESAIAQIRGVLASYPAVERAVLYGSRAMGSYRKGSDIDLTLIGRQLTYRMLLNIDAEIDDLLLPYLFDLSLFSQIENPDLVEHIKRVRIVLYERDARGLGSEAFNMSL